MNNSRAIGVCVQHLSLQDSYKNYNSNYSGIVPALSSLHVGKINQWACKSAKVYFLHAASIDCEES